MNNDTAPDTTAPASSETPESAPESAPDTAETTRSGGTAPTARTRRGGGRKARSGARKGERRGGEWRTGVVSIHPRGFGFVELGGGESAFVPPAVCREVLSGDVVSALVVEEADGRHSVAGAAPKVLERRRSELFGVVVEVDGELRLDGDAHVTNTHWPIEGPAVAGRAVRAVWDRVGWRVQESFEDPLSAEALWMRIMCRFEIAASHPPAAEAEALAIAAISPGGPSGARRDLRDLPTWTVDADHSRDLDDAISVASADAEGAMRVWVHISDVAEVLTGGGALDEAARSFGTSVYLPGRVRPMLPASLSEAALSLVPGEDRNTLSVEMRIGEDGEVRSVDLYESMICSNGRLSYDTVAEMLEGEVPDGAEAEIVEAIGWLRAASARLSVARRRRGGVSAHRVEPELSLHVEDGVSAISPTEGDNAAHQLIERLMVCANESVARWLCERGVPTMLRTHAGPGPGAVGEVELFASHLGYRCGFGAELTPAGLASLEAQMEGSDPGAVAGLWGVLLGHLGRATYTPERAGHFGLGSELYCHFTSPIRRYADVVVHRSVKDYLAGERGGDGEVRTGELATLGEWLNERSRAASRAEMAMSKALWLKAMVEESAASDEVLSWEGRVVALRPRGVFVSLSVNGVSGMLPYSALGGTWSIDDDGLRARCGDRCIELGEVVSVSVASAEPASGELELRPATQEGRAKRRRGRRRGARVPR